MKHPLTVQQRLDREGQGPQPGDHVRGEDGCTTLPIVLDAEGQTKISVMSFWIDWRRNPDYYIYISRADGKPCTVEG